METIDLKTMTKKDLTELLQKKIFQLGMTGLQQNDLLTVINAIETELARRKEENISQANSAKEENADKNSNANALDRDDNNDNA